MRTSLSTIAPRDGSRRAQHGGEVHPVSLVEIAVHDEVSHFRVQHIFKRKRHLFEVTGIIGGGTQHETPPVAERVGIGVGVGNRLWRGGCHRV